MSLPEAHTNMLTKEDKIRIIMHEFERFNSGSNPAETKYNFFQYIVENLGSCTDEEWGTNIFENILSALPEESIDALASSSGLKN